jgi:hypothetical protein
LEISAIEVTDNATGDAPMLQCVFYQIGANEVIASVYPLSFSHVDK